MSVILKCKHLEQVQPYIGVDSTCRQPAVFCVEHDPHKNKQGLLHQMMPLSHFKRSINEMKFKMADKVGELIDQYSNFMDQLIKQITELKLRKTVELSMLWLRELSSNEQQYQNLRKIYRNDYEGFTCTDIHWLYFKILGNQKLQKQKLQDISCYKDICKVMKTLHESAKGKMLIAQKVLQLEGVVQKGQLLRRALPDRKIFRQNTKQILLQGLNNQLFDIKYNKVSLKENTRGFNSIFSKYPLIQHTNYNMLIHTKYTNIMIGVCQDEIKLYEKEAQDLHYNSHSLVFNCSNGCTYRDGMFQSGSSHLTKGQKELQMILRITDTQLIILIGKNVVCRANVEKYKRQRLFLHLLMRTKGDSIEIDRDKYTIIPQMASEKLIQPTTNKFSQVISEVNQIEQMQNSAEMKTSKIQFEQQIYLSKKKGPPISEIIKQAKKTQHKPDLIEVSPMSQSLFQRKKENNQATSQNLLISYGLKKQIPLQSSTILNAKNRDIPRYQQDSHVYVQVQNSILASQGQEISSKYASNSFNDGLMKIQEDGKQSLLNPAVIERLKKSQFQMSLKSSAYDNKFQLNQMSPMPSIRILDRKISGLTNTIRNTQYYDEDD